MLHIQQHDSACINLGSWTNSGSLPNLETATHALQNAWGGDSISWNGQRTFFAGGSSNLVGCWDWSTNSSCPGPDLGNYLRTDNDVTDGLGNARPYGFAQISARCIIGLGHDAVFYSFNPETFGPCIDAKLTTVITPCPCLDGNDGARYGSITFPQDLMDQVATIEATVSTDEFGNNVVGGIDGMPLHIPGPGYGFLDLSGIDQSLPEVYLTLDVNSLVDNNGDPVWKTPYDTTLVIDVSPTLSE